MTPYGSPASLVPIMDPRNDDVEIYVNGRFHPRDAAKVSVFDAGFMLGDGITESLRLVNGRLFAVEDHLDRLYHGAQTIGLRIGLRRNELIGEVWKTLRHNGMEDGVHIRLMITRGVKSAPIQDPRSVIGGVTIVIIAEWIRPHPGIKQTGLRLMTSAIRCSTPDVFDLRLNSHSRLNYVQALAQAIDAGADEALMLDDRGFVASCNSTNFFIVRGKELWTSTGACCFNGITRAKAIDLWRRTGNPVLEKKFTLGEVYSADEAFVTGTLGGITWVSSVDGHGIGTSSPGQVTHQIAGLYDKLVEA